MDSGQPVHGIRSWREWVAASLLLLLFPNGYLKAGPILSEDRETAGYNRAVVKVAIMDAGKCVPHSILTQELDHTREPTCFSGTLRNHG